MNGSAAVRQLIYKYKMKSCPFSMQLRYVRPSRSNQTHIRKTKLTSAKSQGMRPAPCIAVCLSACLSVCLSIRTHRVSLSVPVHLSICPPIYQTPQPSIQDTQYGLQDAKTNLQIARQIRLSALIETLEYKRIY